MKISPFKSPPGFSPFFLKPSPHEQTGFHLQMDTRPLAGRGVAPYRSLLHNAQLPGKQVLPRLLRVYVPTSFFACTFPPRLLALNSAARGISPCLWALCCCLLVGPIPSGSTLPSAVVASDRMMATLRCRHTTCLAMLDDARDTSVMVEPAVN